MCTCIIFTSVCGCATCADSASQTKERRRIVVSSALNEIFWCNFSVADGKLPLLIKRLKAKMVVSENSAMWLAIFYRQPVGLVMSPSIL